MRYHFGDQCYDFWCADACPRMACRLLGTPSGWFAADQPLAWKTYLCTRVEVSTVSTSAFSFSNKSRFHPTKIYQNIPKSMKIVMKIIDFDSSPDLQVSKSNPPRNAPEFLAATGSVAFTGVAGGGVADSWALCGAMGSAVAGGSATGPACNCRKRLPAHGR